MSGSVVFKYDLREKKPTIEDLYIEYGFSNELIDEFSERFYDIKEDIKSSYATLDIKQRILDDELKWQKYIYELYLVYGKKNQSFEEFNLDMIDLVSDVHGDDIDKKIQRIIYLLK